MPFINILLSYSCWCRSYYGYVFWL